MNSLGYVGKDKHSYINMLDKIKTKKDIENWNKGIDYIGFDLIKDEKLVVDPETGKKYLRDFKQELLDYARDVLDRVQGKIIESGTIPFRTLMKSSKTSYGNTSPDYTGPTGLQKFGLDFNHSLLFYDKKQQAEQLVQDAKKKWKIDEGTKILSNTLEENIRLTKEPWVWRMEHRVYSQSFLKEMKKKGEKSFLDMKNKVSKLPEEFDLELTSNDDNFYFSDWFKKIWYYFFEADFINFLVVFYFLVDIDKTYAYEVFLPNLLENNNLLILSKNINESRFQFEIFYE